MTASIGRSHEGEAAEKVRELKSRGINPCLAVILVGENPASQVYVRGKINDCAQCGIESRSINLPADTTQDALLAEVKKLAEDAAVHGILVQLPLPAQIDEKAVIDAIPPEKDVDGFSPVNVGRMQIGEPCYLPCTPAGCIRMIESTGTEIAGKNAVVIGRSNIVGKPGGAAAAGEERHGHDLPLQDGKPQRGLRRRGYSRGRRWPRGLCDRRYGQARRCSH